MSRPLAMRIGAICAGFYVVVSVAGQIVLSSQPQPKVKAHATALEQDSILLTFAHSHAGLLLATALLAIPGSLALGGTAYGVSAYVAAFRPRMARSALAVGVIGLAISLIGQIAGLLSLNSAAGQYATTHLTSTLHHFDDQATKWAIVGLVGAEVTAVWLGLLSVALIQIQGTRSVPGWATLASCFLAGIGFPVLIPWTAGAAAGLWRISNADRQPVADVIEEAAPGATAAASGAQRSGPPVRRGSAAKRRRRR